MGAKAQDQDIIRLLTRVKAADPEYPQHLLTARREKYIRQLGEVSLAVSAGLIAGQTLKSAKAPVTSTLTSKLMEATLLVAIITEAGAVAYLSRDKLADFFQTLTTSESGPAVITPLGMTASPFQPTATPSPGMTATVTVVFSPTPESVITSTLVPSVLVATDPADTTTVTEFNSTPDPGGNNGHHYGQTPKPERTKENNGNDDKPPSNPKPTKQPKPTKTK